MRIDETGKAAKLGGADARGEALDGGGRDGMTGRLESLMLRLPGFARRRIQYGTASALLYLGFLWTATVGAGYTAAALAGAINPASAFLSVPALCIGLLGLRFGTTFVSAIPAIVVWPILAVASFVRAVFVSGLDQPLSLLISFTYVACTAVGLWAVVRWAAHSSSSRATEERMVNRIGWDLFRLSAAPPPTHEHTADIAVYTGLKVGEVERHFDQVTSAAIQGGMKHEFRIKGMSSTLHNVPGFYYDTSSSTRMRGTGVSTVQLGMEGRSTTDLTDDAFVAVFERPGPDGVDTLRGVVPSERQAQAYVSQILTLWSSHLVPNSELEMTLRQYATAISQAVSCDSSYVGDRLGAILRMPAADRPTVTVIGEPLNRHSVLVAAVRFGDSGPLYQLFPTALVRALQTLMEGRPLPPPPAGPPPTPETTESAAESAEAASLVASNGHVPEVRIRTLGGLKIEVAGGDVTSTLLDRKVLAFLWLQLLARKLRNPNDTITRASLADELSPGIDSSTQRARLRGRLSELRNELPPAIGRRIEVSGERIGFSLVDSNVDALTLLEMARAVGGSNGMISPEQLVKLEAVINHTGTFLPEWDDIEHQVNGARGGAGQVVADLRQRVEHATSAVLGAVGAGHLAHGRAEIAVGFLERALEISPDDEAVARSLVSACLQTGRMSRAESLKKDFALI